MWLCHPYGGALIKATPIEADVLLIFFSFLKRDYIVFMRKRIILITNSFPFGTPEASFIRPELPYLIKNFDLTIIARNYTFKQTTDVGELTDVFRYNTHSLNIIEGIKCIIKLNISRLKRELFDNAKNVKHKITALKFAIRAEHFADYVKKIRLKYKQEIIYYCYWNDYSAYGICQLCENNNDKCISRMHGGDLYKLPDNDFYQPFKKYMSSLFSKIIFISFVGKEYYINTYFPDKIDNLIVCYMGVKNEKHIKNSGSTDGIIRILSLSNINYIKRVEKIVEALSLISNHQIVWNHIGDGDYGDFVRKKASEFLDYKKNIKYHFYGKLSNEDVRFYLEKNPVDLLINTSLSEGLPVSMMEAAAFGIPIIGTNVGGVKEIITEDNGYMLDVNFKSKELADLIQDFCYLSKYERNRLRENSFKVWITKFDAEKNYTRLISEINKL